MSLFGWSLPPGCSAAEIDAASELDPNDFTKPAGSQATLVAGSITPDAINFLTAHGATLETYAGLHLVTLPEQADIREVGNGDYQVVFENDDLAPVDYVLYEQFPDAYRSSIEMRWIRRARSKGV